MARLNYTRIKNIAKKAAELDKESGFYSYVDCKSPLDLLSCKAKGISSKDSKKYDYACNVKLLGFRIDRSDINNIKIDIKLEFNPFKNGYGSPVGYPEVGVYEIYPDVPAKRILYCTCSQNSGFFASFCTKGLEAVFNGRVNFSKPKIFEYNNFDNQIQISASKGNFKVFQQMILNKLLEELGISIESTANATLPKAPKKAAPAHTTDEVDQLVKYYKQFNNKLIIREINGSTEQERDRLLAQLEATKNTLLSFLEDNPSPEIDKAVRDALKVLNDQDEMRYRI